MIVCIKRGRIITAIRWYRRSEGFCPAIAETRAFLLHNYNKKEKDMITPNYQEVKN